MLSVLLTGSDADDAGKIRGRVLQVIVIDVWAVGVPATGVLVGTGAGWGDTFPKSRPSKETLIHRSCSKQTQKHWFNERQCITFSDVWQILRM